MFNRCGLAAYLCSRSDAVLRAEAVQVRVWQLRLYDEPSRLRGLLGMVLAVIHEEFGRRGWNIPKGDSSANFQPVSPWGRVHAAARRTIEQMRGNRDADQVPSEVADWLRQATSVAA